MKTAPSEEREFRLDEERDPLRTIRGRLVYPGGAEERSEHCAYVLVLHGFKGFMDWGFYPELTRRLVARGLAVVRFNFSGSGVGADLERFSEERAFFENTPTRELEDVERVRAWLDAGAVPWIDPRRGALLGHSLGGAVALVHAARRGDYAAVVGWASCATFRRFPPEVENLWRRQGFVEIPNLRTKEVHRLGLGWLEDLERNSHALDVHAACRRLTTPTLLVHGSLDDAVPLHEGESLLRACTPGLARLEVVPDANHTFWAAHPFAGASAALEAALGTTVEFVAEELR
ncbi:MAG: alpha/beta fold hydrolase [Planctomycetes bacterium]|nr:alpha/beta fold hydrolase [Planctomycetota bacterium]